MKTHLHKRQFKTSFSYSLWLLHSQSSVSISPSPSILLCPTNRSSSVSPIGLPLSHPSVLIHSADFTSSLLYLYFYRPSLLFSPKHTCTSFSSLPPALTLSPTRSNVSSSTQSFGLSPVCGHHIIRIQAQLLLEHCCLIGFTIFVHNRVSSVTTSFF